MKELKIFLLAFTSTLIIASTYLILFDIKQSNFWDVFISCIITGIVLFFYYIIVRDIDK